jgi:hypothetical protein
MNNMEGASNSLGLAPLSIKSVKYFADVPKTVTLHKRLLDSNFKFELEQERGT